MGKRVNKRDIMEKQIAERIAYFAMKASFDNDFNEVERILKAQGAEINWFHDNSEVHVKTKDMTCGLVMGMDPVTCWAQISMMLFGRLAMSLPFCLKALELVNKQWKVGASLCGSPKQRKERQQIEQKVVPLNPQLDLFGVKGRQ